MQFVGRAVPAVLETLVAGTARPTGVNRLLRHHNRDFTSRVSVAVVCVDTSILFVPFGEWEKNPRLSGEGFSRPAGPES